MTRIFTHSLTHPENQQVGKCSERHLKSDWKDTGHGIHPAGDASEHVSLVREVLLCGYCNAAGEEERDREDETGSFTSSPEYMLQFVFSIWEITAAPLFKEIPEFRTQ